MARITFRQGILRHGKAPNQVFFLQQNGQYVDLVVSPDPTIIAFADGTKDYLYTENTTINSAWGPFAVGQEYWLYWDIDRVSGTRTFGYTTIAPIYSETAPTSPLLGQMWFDLKPSSPTYMQMLEYNGSRWVPVLRVFAAKYFNNQFFSPIDGVSLESNFEGTQAGSRGNTAVYAGALVFDKDGNPIIGQDKKFFTTEDVFTTGVSTGAALKVENILVRAKPIEPIAAYHVVVFYDYDQIKLAEPFDFVKKVYGIVEEDIPTGDIGNVITEGIIFNENWDFTDSVNNPNMSGNINDPIYITPSGALTTNIAESIPGQVAVGAIVGKQKILFSPGLYGAGLGDTVIDHGTLSGLGDDDHPQYLNTLRGDDRYYTKTLADATFTRVGHTHVKSDIVDFAHTHLESDITNLDKYSRSEVDNLLSQKLSLSGGYMLGSLFLPSDPLQPLEAATKQYVDAVAAGLDAKDGVEVATTADIGGTYVPTGGTGGTGLFTGVNLTSLDGSLGTDYILNTGSRILVKDQTDAKQNGIYVVVDMTDPLNATIERAPDQDGTPASEVSPGNYTFVTDGTNTIGGNKGTGWVVLGGTATGPNETIILNTDEIHWGKVSSAVSYASGNNILIDSSNRINVIQAADGGTVDALYWNGAASGIATPFDNQTLTYDAVSNSWINEFLNYLRNDSNNSYIEINNVNDDIVLSSAANINASSAANVNIQSALAINLNSVGNLTLDSGSNNTIMTSGNMSITTNNLDVSSSVLRLTSSSGVGRLELVSGSYAGTITMPSVLSNNVSFVLPPNNGNAGDILSTDGFGNTSWIAPPIGGGTTNPVNCIHDTTTQDNFIVIGYSAGSSPLCTDNNNNVIQIQTAQGTTIGSPTSPPPQINIIGGSSTQANDAITIKTDTERLSLGINERSSSINISTGSILGNFGLGNQGTYSKTTGNIVIQTGITNKPYDSSGDIIISGGYVGKKTLPGSSPTNPPPKTGNILIESGIRYVQYSPVTLDFATKSDGDITLRFSDSGSLNIEKNVNLGDAGYYGDIGHINIYRKSPYSTYPSLMPMVRFFSAYTTSNTHPSFDNQYVGIRAPDAQITGTSVFKLPINVASGTYQRLTVVENYSGTQPDGTTPYKEYQIGFTHDHDSVSKYVTGLTGQTGTIILDQKIITKPFGVYITDLTRHAAYTSIAPATAFSVIVYYRALSSTLKTELFRYNFATTGNVATVTTTQTADVILSTTPYMLSVEVTNPPVDDITFTVGYYYL